jgi:hypothetical protein
MAKLSKLSKLTNLASLRQVPYISPAIAGLFVGLQPNGLSTTSSGAET